MNGVYEMCSSLNLQSRIIKKNLGENSRFNAYNWPFFRHISIIIVIILLQLIDLPVIVFLFFETFLFQSKLTQQVNIGEEEKKREATNTLHSNESNLKTKS